MTSPPGTEQALRAMRVRDEIAGLELVRELRAGDVITHQGVTYRVTHVNGAKRRATIEAIRGDVRTHPGGPPCVRQF